MTIVAVTKFGIRPEWREPLYRIVAAVSTLLLAFGFLDDQKAALWSQLGLSSVTLLFAALFATSTLRKVAYPVLTGAGAVLMAYGIVNDIRWALISAAVVQLFGITTAAAKVVELDPAA